MICAASSGFPSCLVSTPSRSNTWLRSDLQQPTWNTIGHKKVGYLIAARSASPRWTALKLELHAGTNACFWHIDLYPFFRDKASQWVSAPGCAKGITGFSFHARTAERRFARADNAYFAWSAMRNGEHVGCSLHRESTWIGKELEGIPSK
jgi:hypothetical protein